MMVMRVTVVSSASQTSVFSHLGFCSVLVENMPSLGGPEVTEAAAVSKSARPSAGFRGASVFIAAFSMEGTCGMNHEPWPGALSHTLVSTENTAA